MRRRRKILLGLALLFLAGGGVGSWWIYQMMHRDITEAELKVEKGFFDFSSVLPNEGRGKPEFKPDLPVSGEQGGDSAAANTSDTSSADQAGGATTASAETPVDAAGPGKDGTSSNKGTPSTGSSSSKTSATVSLEDQIRNYYYPSFQKLQGLAESRLDELFSRAKQEYEANKDSPGFSKVDFASKYTSAANKLQREVDATFYTLLHDMEADLKRYQLPLRLVEEAKAAYDQRIKAKKDELFKKFF